MAAKPEMMVEPRRRAAAADEDYLRIVGERLRTARARRGMSRKVLAQASGVSERYLAELERGAGNASLLVMRQIAGAMGLRTVDLVADGRDPPIDLALAVRHLERLPPEHLPAARALLARRFGPRAMPRNGRVALIGMRGAGKTTLGQRLAGALSVPFIELDREIERASGADLGEIFAVRGQSVFRQLEFECLERIIAEHGRAVIATGGSLVTEPVTFDLLLSSCFVVWLKASPRQHMNRVVAQGDLRPMAASRSAMGDLRAILESRVALYAKADVELDTTRRTEQQATDALIRIVAARG